MPFRVELSGRAEADVREIYSYIRERGPANPDDGKAGLDQKLASLETFPDSCGFAPENEYTELTVRQLLYGPFRILFETRGERVDVLTVRHGARVFLPPGDLETR
jgi:plasmid stabilization system protein ParE